MKKNPRLMSSIVICLMCGYIIIQFGHVVFHELKQRNSFLSTAGKILSVEVGSESATFDNSTTGAVTSIVYFPKIYYEYEVYGKRYNGDRYGITKRSYRGIRNVESLVRDYHAGDVVTVWYYADKPSVAVLDKRIALLPWVVVGIAISLLIAVLYWNARYFFGTRKS